MFDDDASGVDTEAAPGAPAPVAVVARAARKGAGLSRPEDARSHNRALVLQSLYRGEGLSRADVAREVGLTRVTISDVVAELLAEGLVVELGLRADSRPGKPATLLDINRAGFHVIGVDLSSSTTFRGAITDLSGTVVAREELDVARLTGAEVVDAAGRIIESLVSRADRPVIGVGVGSPGLVDADGRVLSAPGLGWHDVPLQREREARIGLPVLVANDANVAALAERTFGGGSDDMMVIRIGRGVGSGLVVGGHPVQGSRWAAGEIGHVVVGTDEGQACPCGKSGCLETWLGAPHVEAKLASAGTAAEREEILREAGGRLGIVLAPVVGALNLAEVVVAGPQELLDVPFMRGLDETLRQRTMAELHGDLTVRATELGRDIVVLGAVVMVLTGQLGVS
jgi:predicted NBD/HSP70 family sugar kinase